MAIDRGRPEPRFDPSLRWGIQYVSQDYRNQLVENAMKASITCKGNCYDNTAMDSFRSTFKHELIFIYMFKTRDEAKVAIFD
jgi:putative transposase